MKNKFIALALSVLVSMPCILRAEEIEIQLMEVIQMSPLPGDDPLDDPIQSPNDPPRPRDFHATINGNALTITTQNTGIQSAQAMVVTASTGSIVVNEQFTSSLNEQITNAGVYILHIQTENGALVGQFIVQ